MTDSEVLDATRNWIASITGILWIDAHQGAPAPAEPYGVINLINADAVYKNPVDDDFSVAEEGTEDEAISHAPVRDWRWNFSLNLYGPDGSTILRKLKTAQKVQTALRPLLPLSLFETSQVRSLPELINEKWHPRSEIDIEIRGLVRDGYVIDVAETADVTFTPV